MLAQFESRRRHLSTYSAVLAKDFGLLSTLHEHPRSEFLEIRSKRPERALIALPADITGRQLRVMLRARF